MIVPKIDTSILVTIASSILTIFLMVYVFLKSFRSKKPLYLKRSSNFISAQIQEIGGIKVLFEEKPIKNLIVSKIAIWNGGRDTIDYADQAPTDKIRIHLKDNAILFGAKIIFQTSKPII